MTGRTTVEKILSTHVGRDVRAGELVVSPVDVVMAQDGNAPLAIRILTEELGASRTFDPERVVLVIDHCGPSPNEGASNLQRMMREFCRDFGARLFDIGEGISHVVLPESGLARPGSIVVGSDSHTLTYGALNCLGTGMGSTDIAVAMFTGTTWLRAPETIRVRFVGQLGPGATAKDAALELVRRVGVDGATYRCLEMHGPGLAHLSVDNRLTICNMGIEMGAKCTMMPLDDQVRAFLEQRMDDVPSGVWSDPDATFEAEHEIDLGAIEPMIILPHDLTRIVRASDHRDLAISQAFIGTCTNSRFEDLAAAAAVIGGNRIAPGVRLIVTPGSRDVYLRAMRAGHIETFIEAGGVVTPPGCGACVGTHLGVPADGDVVISTANRNFKGRMGNPRSSIVLASPETVAASAITGHVSLASDLHDAAGARR